MTTVLRSLIDRDITQYRLINHLPLTTKDFSEEEICNVITKRLKNIIADKYEYFDDELQTAALNELLRLSSLGEALSNQEKGGGVSAACTAVFRTTFGRT